MNSSKHKSIHNEYILITGASRGIGRAIAQLFAREGYSLILVAKNNKDALADVCEYAKSFGADCHTYLTDVSDPEAVRDLHARVSENHISISGIINNAGISTFGLFQDISIEEWRQVLDTNLSSVFYVCKYFIDDLLSKHNGHIINISSVWGNVGASCEVAYSASKGGLNSLTKALAKELAPSNISVNALACGAIDTDMNHRLTSEERTQLVEEIPAGRMGLPEEVAQAVYNIYVSPAYLTGQIITMDGGWT